MRNFLTYLISIAALSLCLALPAEAQFKEQAFTQQYNDDPDAESRDTTDVLFSFGEYFGGLRHTRDARIGTVMAGSTVFVGGAQIYNRQYWKLPLVYGGIAAGIGGGIVYNHKWKDSGTSSDDRDGDLKTASTLFFAGAGLVYWGAIMDGTVNYKKDIPHQNGKATMYSLLFPGLGQAYNGEYWKIPIYYGLMLGSAHFYAQNNKNYHRYRRIYNEASADGYTGPISASTALYYRNIYRRYRDYSIVAMVGSYLLQVIDANVFSYMRDFDLSDDIGVAMNISPAVISEEPVYAWNPYGEAFSGGGHVSASPGGNGLGLKIGFTF